MKKIILPLFIMLLFIRCAETATNTENNSIWGNAQWIVFEQLQDSMLVVPGVHVLNNAGDEHLGDKALKRPVSPIFRKDFSINSDIKNVTINISGLGHYELHVNNTKIGDRFLSPGWTDYEKRSLYNTFDITEQVKKGDNAIGVLVGNGFYNVNRERYRKLVVAHGNPKLIFNITVTYENGTTETIVSDENCKVAPSPITFNSIFGGEDYDANQEQKDWSLSGFDDSKWQKALVLNDTKNTLFPEEDYPLMVMDTFSVQKISTSKTGRTIYDFGQNASGIIALKVKGNKGTQIKIRPDELINDEGNVTQKSGGGPYEFNYTLKGDGEEEWQPRFTYYGFRYVDVEIIEPDSSDVKTEVLELKMLHTRNSSPRVGSFVSSDSLFNNIYELIGWGIKSNMASVSTDCPHREKLGWLEQTYLIGPSMHYNFDIQKMYGKIVTDMMDAQLENGLVPDISPEYVEFDGPFRDSPEWGSASVTIPWQLYKWYGDTEVLEKAYPMMTKYVDYLETKLQDNILNHGLGDWYDLGPEHPGVAQLTPKSLTATTIYYYDLMLVSKTAALFGNKADEKKYTDLADNIKKAFQEKFYDSKTGICSTGSQTAYAMSLYTGILPETDKEKIFNNLIESIKQNDYALTSGDIGYHFLVRVLSENGKSDVLYKMNNRIDRPGYGYQLEQGATALTESWSALPDVSNNHMMLGHLMEWFYTGLGGIYQVENSTAYKEIVIAPKPVGDMKWVKCSYNSPQGLIRSDWELSDSSWTLNVEVPKNTTAKIHIPEQFKNGSITVTDVDSQKAIDTGQLENIFELNTGKYKVVVKL